MEANWNLKLEKQVEIEGFGTELLTKWFNQIKQKLEVAGEGEKYVYVPFRRPDKNLSFALHKTKFYAVECDAGETFNLKQLDYILYFIKNRNKKCIIEDIYINFL